VLRLIWGRGGGARGVLHGKICARIRSGWQIRQNMYARVFTRDTARRRSGRSVSVFSVHIRIKDVRQGKRCVPAAPDRGHAATTAPASPPCSSLVPLQVVAVVRRQQVPRRCPRAPRQVCPSPWAVSLAT
jgi:hypothetical protein